MRTQVSFFLIFLIVFLSSVNYAFACSCIQSTEKENLERSFASFVGTPIKIETLHGQTNRVTFEIEKPVKNISEEITQITLFTPAYVPACGYHFENNTRYLVHTHDEKNQKQLETSLCSGNQNLGFSSIPLLIDGSVLGNYVASSSLYPIILFFIIAGIVIGIIAYGKKKKPRSNNN